MASINQSGDVVGKKVVRVSAVYRQPLHKNGGFQGIDGYDDFSTVFEGDINIETRKDREQAHESLEKMYDNDALVQQAVQIPVVDAITNWREIADAELKKKDKEYNLRRLLLNTSHDARLYGRVLIIPIMHRPGDPDSRIRVDRTLEGLLEDKAEIGAFVFLHEFDDGEKKETNPLSPFYKQPTHYELPNGTKIRRDRVIVQYGSIAKNSILQGTQNYFYKFHTTFDELARATTEANVDTLATDIGAVEAQAEAEAIMDNSTRTADDVLEFRARNFKGNSTTKNIRIIDKETEDIIAVSRGNIGDLAKANQQAADMLCAAIDYVPSRILGKQYGSMARSDTSDIQNAIQILRSMHVLMFDPPIQEIDEFIGKFYPVKNFEYEWKDLPMERFLEIGTDAQNEEPSGNA